MEERRARGCKGAVGGGLGLVGPRRESAGAPLAPQPRETKPRRSTGADCERVACEAGVVSCRP